jgi:hypothetical protein
MHLTDEIAAPTIFRDILSKSEIVGTKSILHLSDTWLDPCSNLRPNRTTVRSVLDGVAQWSAGNARPHKCAAPGTMLATSDCFSIRSISAKLYRFMHIQSTHFQSAAGGGEGEAPVAAW